MKNGFVTGLPSLFCLSCLGQYPDLRNKIDGFFQAGEYRKVLALVDEAKTDCGRESDGLSNNLKYSNNVEQVRLDDRDILFVGLNDGRIEYWSIEMEALCEGVGKVIPKRKTILPQSKNIDS